MKILLEPDAPPLSGAIDTEGPTEAEIADPGSVPSDCSMSPGEYEDLPEVTLHETKSDTPSPHRSAYDTTVGGQVRISSRDTKSGSKAGTSTLTSGGEDNAPKIEPGGQLGAYELLEQIGSGGMATIFRARDTRNGRIVAVKALHAYQAKTLAGRRFQREYRAIRRLAHPNIVQVYEYGVEEGQPFIAMEYVAGPDLKNYLKELRKKPSEIRWREVEHLVAQICHALEEVHGRGIIHRDLKPSNVLLTKDRKAKLTDFGVAKPEEASVQLTLAGMLVGTLAYLAPEVFEQAALDQRVDLYALGVMMYVMLTSKLPFSGRNIAEIMEKHIRYNPEMPRAINPDAPEHLEQITMRLLEKDPAKRFQSAASVLRALKSGQESAKDEPVLETRNPDFCWVPRLVGRAEQLEVLLGLVSALGAGKGGVLVVDGPDGAGKSRLVETGLAVAHPRGIAVYSGRCLEGHQQWAEGFRDVVAEINAEAERTGFASVLLGKLFAQIGSQDVPAPLEPPKAQGPEIEKDMAELFLALTRKRPRVVWIDEVNHADEGTLRILASLREVAAKAPLLLVVTLKHTDGPLPETLERLFERDTEAVDWRRIHLAPLCYSDVVDLLEFMYPTDPRVGALAKRLYMETEGNPLALTDTLRFLVSRGRMRRRLANGKSRWVMSMSAEEIAGRVQLPRGIAEILRGRLTAYPGQTRTLLRLVAVWGREISFRTLLRLASAPEEALMAHMERLLADGWLAEDWLGSDERYRLAHPTYRSVLLNQLSATDRKKLRGFIDMRLSDR